MGVHFTEIRKSDLADERLAVLNDLLRTIVDEINRLGGEQGAIQLLNDLDLQGHQLLNNGGAAASASTAATKTTASTTVAASATASPAPATTAAGSTAAAATSVLSNPLLVRRLNDPTQRENSSTFLTNLGSIVPNTNTSQVTGVDAGGGNSTITVTAGYAPMADGSRFSYPARIDTVSNPLAGAAKVYYYYVELPNHILRLDGPYTADTSSNRFNSMKDGHMLIAIATVKTPAGGGVPDYGGGGGDDPIEKGFNPR